MLRLLAFLICMVGFSPFGYAKLAAIQSWNKPSGQQPVNLSYSNDSQQLLITILRDDILEITFQDKKQSRTLPKSSKKESKPTHVLDSPMLKRATLTGPQTWEQTSSTSGRTDQLSIDINDRTLCLSVKDISSSRLQTLCPIGRSQFRLAHAATAEVYGLGSQFQIPTTSTTLPWHGRWQSPSNYGNAMVGFAGGAVGHTQFPVAHIFDGTDGGYGVSWLVDETRALSWQAADTALIAQLPSSAMHAFLWVGKTVQNRRATLLDLTGRPPLPPLATFGFWMSEYGYDSWAEMLQKYGDLRRNDFPVDGFYLDLQWFGGVRAESDETPMGRLTFDEEAFPNPKSMIAQLAKKGIRVAAIEESYVGRGLDEHRDLAARGLLAHDCSDINKASYLTKGVHGNEEWWGRGGMLDWSNPEARAYWHDTKRRHLYDLGIMSSWIDLGEPEMFDPRSCYYGDGSNAHGAVHSEIHNTFSLNWAKGIQEGLATSHPQVRPTMLARSGTLGIQRYGVALWTGDIGGNMPSLAAHLLNAQHLRLAGVDLISSDIGGFHRRRQDGSHLTDQELTRIYTRWFAHSAFLDIPFRVHTLNTDNRQETLPTRIGDATSQGDHARLRYMLIPYYYDLAFRATTTGEPIFAPLFSMEAQVKAAYGRLDGQMIGKDILVAHATDVGLVTQEFKLPDSGHDWYDLATGEFLRNNLKSWPLFYDGHFRLPAFVRAGSFFPVASQSVQNTDEFLKEQKSILRLAAYQAGSDQTGSEFTHYEDDGSSRAYERGDYRTTKLVHSTRGITTTLNIIPSHGQTDETRNLIITYMHHQEIGSVHIANTTLEPCKGSTSRSQSKVSKVKKPARLDPCWQTNKSGHTEIFALQPMHTALQITITHLDSDSRYPVRVPFVCENATTSPGQSVYVVGSSEELGAWNPQLAIPLAPNSYPTWSTVATLQDADRPFDWKCIIRNEMNAEVVAWEKGEDHHWNGPTDVSGLQSEIRGRF